VTETGRNFLLHFEIKEPHVDGTGGTELLFRSSGQMDGMGWNGGARRCQVSIHPLGCSCGNGLTSLYLL
jgi:hypothetical protein